MATSIQYHRLGDYRADPAAMQDATNSVLRESIGGARPFISILANVFNAYREHRAAMAEMSNLSDRALGEIIG